jgi:hypothetical protein
MSRGKAQKINIKNRGSGIWLCILIDVRPYVSPGFGLLEVMFALFILSFSLLALANLTTVSMRRTYDAYFVNAAVTATANRLEAALVKDDLYENDWQNSLNTLLPQSHGSYTPNAGGGKVKICWEQLFHKHKFCYEAQV